IQEHDLAAANVTVISSDVQFFLQRSTPRANDEGNSSSRESLVLPRYATTRRSNKRFNKYVARYAGDLEKLPAEADDTI
ncbi:hypothetical protein, partial [Acinetobacter baumannii]|uniref:hypothetical protein n=1 Tax=Acinetobacter baumannii TaxID=470 RepID=UPI001BB46881